MCDLVFLVAVQRDVLCQRGMREDSAGLRVLIDEAELLHRLPFVVLKLPFQERKFIITLLGPHISVATITSLTPMRAIWSTKANLRKKEVASRIKHIPVLNEV